MIDELIRQVNDLQRQIDRLVKPEIRLRRLVAIIQDQKAQNTAGGSFNSGAWRTRDLNTTVYSDLTGYSLAANQFTLPAGTYFIEASAPAVRVNAHQARLYNATDASEVLPGTSEKTYGAGDDGCRSFVFGDFTIASSKTFEIQHQCTTTKATDGFGANCNFTTEIYTEVRIWKL